MIFSITLKTTALQVKQRKRQKDLIPAVTGVYGLCCSHLVHSQKKKTKLHPLALLSSPSIYLNLSFISSSTALFCASLWTLVYIFSNSLLSPSSLLLLSSLLRFIIPLYLPLRCFSKLIALKHSRLLTSTPLCPPQSHITQSPLVLTSFCT